LEEEALDRTMWRNRFARSFGPVVWQITDDDDNPSDRTMALGSTQLLTEISTRSIYWSVKATVGTYMCRLSWNMEASTSWNPQDLSVPVMRLLYRYIFTQRYAVPHLVEALRFKPESGTMTLGLTQPLTEMCTRNMS
jgi:hypothetical protein